jgi:enamine deaminase RidA (YjgF/YER057c/UK114 family)
MPTDPHAKLAELGLSLPKVSPPGGSYVPAVRSGNHVYVSGQVPMMDGEIISTGKVGADITVERARELSRHCALAALAAIDSVAGLDHVVRIVKVVGFVASAEGFSGQPGVVNGASDLFVAVFGEAGRHARSAIGVAELPLGSPVEVEVIAEVAD